MKDWGQYRNALKAIPNPSINSEYEVQMDCPEVTFLGCPDQPDFGDLTIRMYPRRGCVELKSLKKYLWQFRDQLFSYERLVNVIYDDLYAVFQPRHLSVELRLKPRGGIATSVRRVGYRPT